MCGTRLKRQLAETDAVASGSGQRQANVASNRNVSW
jgi:hypothetical protein